jgi:parallel beta-helix repeat protein
LAEVTHLLGLPKKHKLRKTDIEDVDVSNPQDGQALVFEASSGKWKNQSLPGGGAGTPSDTVVNETSFGQSADPGVSSAYSRGDHTHGTPPHTKEIHDALGIDAATLQGSTKAEVQDHEPKVHGDAAHSVSYEKTANKGVANGYCGLNASAFVPLSNIPTPLTGKDADTVDGKHASDLANALHTHPASDITTDLAWEQIDSAFPKTIAELLSDHNKTVHDDLDIDADTLDGSHASAFAQASHTHVEADITNLDHDAQKIKGKIVDDTDIGDGKVLGYNASLNKIVYLTGGGGGAYRRSATKIVAANDSLDKTNADYICDGTADEAEIEAAINALPTSGGRVLLMEGTYYISSSIDILKSKVTLQGQGHGTVIKVSNGANCNVIVVGNGSMALNGVVVRDLKIDGNRANQTSNGIGVYLYGASGYLLSDCAILNVDVVDTLNAGIHGAYCYRLVISSCRVTNPYHSCYRLLNSSFCVIFLCIAKDARSGYRAYQFGSCYDCVLSSCVGENVGTYGFEVAGDRNVISACCFRSGGYGGLLSGNRNAVSTCVFSAMTSDGLFGSPYESVISGNVSTGNSGNGIQLSDGDRNIIANNRCEGNGGYGIKISSSTAEKNLVHGNILLGNTAGAISDAGTGTVQADNITS